MRHPNVIERLIRVNFAIDRFGRLPQLYTGLVYYYEVTFFSNPLVETNSPQKMSKGLSPQGCIFFFIGAFGCVATLSSSKADNKPTVPMFY